MVKVKFIPTTFKFPITLPEDLLKSLPPKLIFFTTSQFLHEYDQVKRQLEDAGKEVIVLRGKHASSPGQIVGCSLEEFKQDFDAFFFLGDGLFHPKALLLKNNKPVFVYNPFNKNWFVLSKEDVDQELKRTKAAFISFLRSKNIGVLVSVKPGQYLLQQPKDLEERFPNKKFYYFIFDTIDFSSLENFNFIECWLNTACPRIGWDDNAKLNLSKPIISLEALNDFLDKLEEEE